MRRQDRQVTDIAEIRRILKESKVLHLGLSEDGMPYVVPMNYGFSLTDGKLTFYMHGAHEGRKLDVIRSNPACCVQLDCGGSLVPGDTACRFGYSYASLIAFGTAVIVRDPEEKKLGLRLIMEEQTGQSFDFDDAMAESVTVLRIDCDSYTAKSRPLPADR